MTIDQKKWLRDAIIWLGIGAAGAALSFNDNLILKIIGWLMVFFFFNSIAEILVEATIDEKEPLRQEIADTIKFLEYGVALSLNKYLIFNVIGWLILTGVFVWFSYLFIKVRKEDVEAFEKAKNGSEKDIDFLINGLVDNRVDCFYRSKLLAKLRADKAINLFCQRWSQNRHKKLTQILLRAGYVATQPDDVRVLTALKVGKIQICIDQNPKLVKYLLSAFEDQDLDIASRAKKYAINLINQSAIDELFYLCVEKSNQIAYQCIQQAKYQSTNIKYKAFFHFLRDEWTAYDDLDFDQAILQQIYQSVSPELRKMIAEKARKRGWTEWLRVAQKSREKMNSEDWEITISILKNNREFAKMWQLVRQSPVWVAQKLVVGLSRISYHSSPENHAFYQQLLLLANQCQTLKVSEINTENKSQLLFSAQGEYKAISPDWQFLLTYDDNNKKTKMWRISDGQLLLSADGEYREISPDWQFLLTTGRYGGENPKVWRITDGQLLLSFRGEYKAISPDWQFLITYDKGNTKLWRISDSQLLFSAQEKYKEISPDWQFLLTTNYDGKYPKVWRIADGQLLLSAQGNYTDIIRISPDWQFLLTTNYGSKDPKVWRIADGQFLFSVRGYCHAISPDWQFLATDYYYDRDGDFGYYITKINRITDGQLLFSAVGKYKGISPDWQFLTTEYNRGTIKEWKISDTHLPVLFSIEEIISPDSQLLLTGYYPTKVWRIADGQLLFSADGEYKEISPDWQFLLTSYNGNPKVWRIADGQLLFSTDGEYKEISPDWQFLITTTRRYGGENPKVWRIADGQLLFSADGEYKEISPDWQFLLTYDDDNKKTRVWRILDTLKIANYYYHKFTDQLSVYDIDFFKYVRNQSNNSIYTDGIPWLDLMIKLAEYNLSFDVDITEDSPPAEMSEFDIEIEGHAISDFDIEIESHEIHDLDFDIEIEG